MTGPFGKPRLGPPCYLKTGVPVLAVGRVAQTHDGTAVEYRERHVNTAHDAYLNVLARRPARYGSAS